MKKDEKTNLDLKKLIISKLNSETDEILGGTGGVCQHSGNGPTVSLTCGGGMGTFAGDVSCGYILRGTKYIKCDLES